MGKMNRNAPECSNRVVLVDKTLEIEIQQRGEQTMANRVGISPKERELRQHLWDTEQKREKVTSHNPSRALELFSSFLKIL